MKIMTKFLALMPLVVLGAACNGGSPVAPSNPLAIDELSGSAPNAAVASKDLVPNDCRDITGVNLEVLSSNAHPGIVIQATYVRLGTSPSPTRCAPPIWTSNPRGALVPSVSTFRVGVSSMRPVTVTAMAPNGVKGSVTLGGKTAGLDGSAVCKNVTGVKLTLAPPTSTTGTFAIRATYISSGPSMDICAAPVWASSPRGALSATKDGFRVGVSSMRPVTVTATAPNGATGEITLKK